MNVRIHQTRKRARGAENSRAEQGARISLAVLSSPLVFLLAIQSGLAQMGSPGPQLSQAGNLHKGFHLYNTYAYSSYISGPLSYYLNSPTGALSGSPLLSNGLNDGRGSLLSGGGVTVGWQSSRRNSGVSILYSASVYERSLNNTGFGGLHHRLYFNLGGDRNRRFSRRWSAGLSGAARTMTYEDLLFSPTTMGAVAVATVPLDFNVLAQGVASGRFTDDQIASLLTGAPATESPAQLLLYGRNSLMASLGLTIGYAYSPRLTLTADLGASRMQALPDLTSASRQYRLLPQTSTGRAAIGASYSLSARTTLGFGASTTRTLSRFQDMYSSRAELSIGRVMGRRWFTALQGGAAKLMPIREVRPGRKGVQYTATGTLGVKTFSHTVMLSAGRTVMDDFGLGTRVSINSTAAWAWAPRGTPWQFFTSVARYNLHGSVLGNIASWRAYSGFTRRLSRTTSVTGLYSYMTNNAVSGASPADRTLSGAMLTLVWTPSGGALR